MTKSKGNPLTDGASGRMGNIVFRHTKTGKTIMCHKPDFSNRQFSQDQLSHQDKVKLAAAYGVANKENPIYVQKAEGTDKNAYNLAFKDWFHPPVLHGLQCRNGCLRVIVTDDMLVALVSITILDPDGNVVERGEAQPVDGVAWEYQSVNRGRILVEAWDLPGNAVQHEFCPPAGNPDFWEMSVKPAAKNKRAGKFKKSQKAQQPLLLNDVSKLPHRAQKYLKDSWAGVFRRDVFLRIPKDRFAVLYETASSDPKVPVNLLVGLERLKEWRGWSDEELYERFLFDLQVRYAVGCDNFGEADFDLHRLHDFRNRLNEHALTTGEDLMKGIFESIPDEQR